MSQRRMIMITSLLLAIFSLAGCQKAAEKAAEKAIESGIEKESGGKAKVDLSTGKVTVETKDGTSSYSGGKDAKIPDNFPKDIYVYEGATIVAAVAVPDGFSLSLESKDPSEKVLSAIKGKMTGAGWKEEASMNQGKTSMISFKKEKRTAAVTIDAKESGSIISIIASSEKAAAK